MSLSGPGNGGSRADCNAHRMSLCGVWEQQQMPQRDVSMTGTHSLGRRTSHTSHNSHNSSGWMSHDNVSGL